MKKILSVVTPGVILFVGLFFLAVQAFSMQAEELKQPIREALDRGDTTHAVELLNKEIELDKTYYLNYSLLGQIYFKQAQYERAKSLLEQAFEKKKKDVENKKRQKKNTL